jgi:hypothetical protein
MSNASSAVLLAFLLVAGRVAWATEAGPCVKPEHFVDLPHPAPAAMARLVSHTEEITIERPLDQVMDLLARTKLEQAIAKTASLASVAGTSMLTGGDFGPVGSRRLACLTDGSTLEGEVLQNDRTAGAARFRYVVWNYTTDAARPVSYAVGYFERTALPGDRTHVRWTYGFELRGDRFPGFLGGLGDFLFRVTFLDHDYAELMRATLAAQKRAAEGASAAH